MGIDQRERAVSVSRVLKPVPSHRKTLVGLLLLTFFFGFVYRIWTNSSLANALVYGGSEGVLLLGLPALLASALARLAAKREFKYYAFIGALGALVSAP